MLASSDLMAFASTTDAARSTRFYRDVLGLELVEEQPYAVVFRSNGTILRIQKVQEVTPAAYTTLGWIVPDIAVTVAALGDKGVTFERYDGMQQDALGVWASPGGGKVAWFKDPDGNLLSLSQG